MKLAVVRSSLYYQDNINVVEIETHGLDNVSAGMFVVPVFGTSIGG